MLKVWEKDVLQSGRNGLKNEVRPLKRLKNLALCNCHGVVSCLVRI